MSLLNTRVPEFSAKAVRKGSFEDVSDESLLGQWSVLFFYPADFTFVCPTELFDVHEHYAELKEMGVEVYGISTDSVWAHEAWAESTPLISHIEYPLVSDHTLRLSTALGVLDEGTGMAQRATFIVDPKAIIRSVEISDGPVARRADELVRRVKASQFVSGELGRMAKATWAFEGATEDEQRAAARLPETDPFALYEAGLSTACPLLTTNSTDSQSVPA